MTSSSSLRTSHFSDLPPEIIERVLLLLDDDTLVAAESVCLAWRDALSGQSAFYRQKCLTLRAQYPALTPPFRRGGLDLPEGLPAHKFRSLYFGARRLLRHGLTPDDSADLPTVRVLDCLSSQNPVAWEEWRRRYNYRGVYDMVYDHASATLACSVFDCIQVWDSDSCRCVAVVGPESLDKGGSCFHFSDGILASGTISGKIRLLDPLTSEVLYWYQPLQPAHCICDLKIVGDTLLTVDCYGNACVRKLHRHGGGAASLSQEEHLSLPLDEDCPDDVRHDYRKREFERLLDFTEDFAVTTTRQHLMIFSLDKAKAGSEVYLNSRRSVLCCKADGRDIFWGEQNGAVCRYTLHDFSPGLQWVRDTWDKCRKVMTRFTDNVTSLDVSPDFVVIGDVNGEIHICHRHTFGHTGQPDYVLETGHCYGAFVWCVQIDAGRIFSGDSDGKLVVHDFWKSSSGSEKGQPDEKKAKQAGDV